jgi:hypothetical protein
MRYFLSRTLAFLAQPVRFDLLAHEMLDLIELLLKFRSVFEIPAHCPSSWADRSRVKRPGAVAVGPQIFYTMIVRMVENIREPRTRWRTQVIRLGS